ncbi:MAG: hypothetical protein MZV65_20130 [Chromatiales bacterium]|nr:hypothetical protein [Chromatiales bacterium]
MTDKNRTTTKPRPLRLPPPRSAQPTSTRRLHLGSHRSPPPIPKSGRGLAGFALLIALGAAGGSGYLWYLWQQEQAAQAGRLDQQRSSRPSPSETLNSRP